MHINFEVEEGHEAFSLLIPALAESQERALITQHQVYRKVLLRK